MKWTSLFDLYLFDFDGLLVNTEHMHFQAYKNMCAARNVTFPWSFHEYLSYAHVGAEALKDAFREQFPSLFENERWETLYADKKKKYLDLLQTGTISLMPGVYSLLETLEKEGKRRVVVTNSFKEQTDFIKASHDILQTIPHWITREDYTELKPHPEGYLRAIQLFGEKGDRIIGFEDSIRGVTALTKTPALPVLVCSSHYPLLSTVGDLKIAHYESIDQIPSVGPSYRTELA